ncbi:MAG TPA: diguanylate cyclase, partial [Candidatus Limnocylindrales bacterium]|nr:diguanylate cyclase [Candidatus Limnocylindrales bacterium]
MVELTPETALAVAAVVVALAGALLGTAGFAALVVRREQRRTAAHLEALLAGHVPNGRVRDRRIAELLDELGRRIGEAVALATTDRLTGVLNRQAILVRLQAEVDRAVRYHRPLSIALVDLDHFKRLNDTHGHAAGDVVLNAVAGLLRSHLRAVDVVGRYGGEEFMIVLPETEVDAAASLVEKLRRLVGSHPVALPDGDRIAVTISAGVTGGVGSDLHLGAIVRDADAALYSAKALGRNQVYVFREVEDASTVRRAQIAPSARRQAIEVGRAAMGAATRTLTDVLAGRPAWAGRPSALIAEVAMAVGRSVGLTEGEIERIRTASLLHDLGKLAIPEEILRKPAPLTDAERMVLERHPQIGFRMLESLGVDPV